MLRCWVGFLISQSCVVFTRDFINLVARVQILNTQGDKTKERKSDSLLCNNTVNLFVNQTAKNNQSFSFENRITQTSRPAFTALPERHWFRETFRKWKWVPPTGSFSCKSNSFLHEQRQKLNSEMALICRVGGVLRSIFAGYVQLASQSSYTRL